MKKTYSIVAKDPKSREILNSPLKFEVEYADSEVSIRVTSDVRGDLEEIPSLIWSEMANDFYEMYKPLVERGGEIKITFGNKRIDKAFRDYLKKEKEFVTSYLKNHRVYTSLDLINFIKKSSHAKKYHLASLLLAECVLESIPSKPPSYALLI